MTESTLVPDQLLATKFFVPHAAHALIARPQLTALLNGSLRHKTHPRVGSCRLR